MICLTSTRSCTTRRLHIITTNKGFWVKTYKRTFTTDVLDKIRLTMEIEKVYNESYYDRHVLPLEINALQIDIIKGNLPIHMDDIIHRIFNVYDLSMFEYDMIMKNPPYHTYANNYCFTNYIVDEFDDQWIHSFEAGKSLDSLLLMAVTNILLKKHVIRRLMIPQNLTKMDEIRDSHYQFLNGLKDVESLFVVNLNSEQFNRADMIKNLHNVCHSNGIIGSIIKEYINLPVYDGISKTNISWPTIVPLGDITRCLIHILYQDLFDREVAAKFPELFYSRWGQSIVIVNHTHSKVKFGHDDVCKILKELNLKAVCHPFYAGRGYRKSNEYICMEAKKKLRLSYCGAIFIDNWNAPAPVLRRLF